jgi:putative inorganic carbon (hco3(-)) transporter
MTRVNITTLSMSFLRMARFTLNHKSGILTGAEFVLIIVLYAIFMVSDKVTSAGLAALGFLWIARWWITSRLTLATPMDMPILGILIMLPVSLYASTDWSLSLPKIYGIILGVAIFYAIVNAIDTILKVNLTITGLILLSIAVSGLGLVGTDWLSNKLFSLQQVYKLLPRLIQAVPRSIAGGIHPNIIGGALAFFIPLQASLLWDGWEFKIMQFVKNERLADIVRVSSKPFLIFSLAITSATLLLTQSRGSILGVFIGLFALAVWHDRRFLWVIPLAALGLLVMVQVWGSGSLTEFVSRMDTTGGGTFPGRMEIWQRAIYMIQDFPFSGVGIGTFDPVAHVLYPFFLVGPDVQIPHAHNMLLEVAVDLGIPGLVFYAALLSAFAFSVWRAYQKAARPWRGLIVGLACGMLAHQIFGIMDAYMLGTKLGAVMWLFFGLVTTLYIRRDQLAMEFTEYDNDKEVEKAGKSNVMGSSAVERKSGVWQWLNRLGTFFLPFAYWALFSMLAISFVGDQPYISLAIALVGGGILGFICIKATESKNSYKRIA